MVLRVALLPGQRGDKKSPAPTEGAGHSQGERRLLVIRANAVTASNGSSHRVSVFAPDQKHFGCRGCDHNGIDPRDLVQSFGGQRT